MKTTPMCQNLDSSSIPKQGATVQTVQKLGYAVLNTAAQRLIQEEVNGEEVEEEQC